MEFSQNAIENLKSYVYLLIDPRNGEVFYVGKGNGNRVFAHLNCAVDSTDKSNKLDTIREIMKSGCKVKHYILRHGLEDKQAFEVEAAMIDFIGMKNLVNIQGGHRSNDYGLKTCEEINAMYDAKKLNTTLPVMLININSLFERDMSDDALYEAVRKWWVVGKRREKAEYAIAVYRGLTREVYKIKNGSWKPLDDNQKRWSFEREPIDDELRNELRLKDVKQYFGQGSANPIKYINCD